MQIDPMQAIDFYKAGHRQQYPEGTSMVYSNMTARSAKLFSAPEPFYDNTVTFFGLQYFIKDFLQGWWQDGFFRKPKREVLSNYDRRMSHALGAGVIPTDHVAALHDLGYLPIRIKALPEGTNVPIGVPFLVKYNTKPEFYWLTNYLETALSAYVWKLTTTATIARTYRKMLEKYAKATGVDLGFVDYQAHDFSARGMSGVYDAAASGAGHLTSFKGTDSVHAIEFVEQYYYADHAETLGGSVPATEHSVMCMGGLDDEIGVIRRLITEVHPRGPVSIVSDTWDFWNVIAVIARSLKDEIMARDGKVIFRPDSGDPAKIICGDPEATPELPAFQGAVEVLWNIFGGTRTARLYRAIDPHVGLIYGDSITLQRANAILQGLMAKNFASSNIVLGVGSYTYQHVTRDTFGFAVKSTYGEVNGVGRPIYKSPKTDSGTKHSAHGLLSVKQRDGRYVLEDMQTQIDMPDCQLQEVFRNGLCPRQMFFQGIRDRATGRA